MSIFHLKNVTKTFKNGSLRFNALSNISISFPEKGLVSIIGKSGSGKSTLLNILMGIEKPTEGEVIFDKYNLSRMSKREFSFYHLYYISMVYQHYNLFDNLTPYQNVALPLLMRGENKKNIEADVNKLFSRFNLEYLINQKTATLSGGEKQRVAILRALAINPKVILCDEPTGALDSKNATIAMEQLKKISKKTLVIMVSHNEEIVKEYSDRIITLQDGVIINDTNSKYIPKTFLMNIKKKYRDKWRRFFLKKNLKENVKKNIFSLISLIFGFTSILLSIGFYVGSKESIDNVIYTSLSSEYIKLSDKSIYEIENSPLSYEKSKRPSEEQLDEFLINFPNSNWTYNFDYLFSTYPDCVYNKVVIDSPTFTPIYSFKDNSLANNLLVYGDIPATDSLDEIIVNEEFVRDLKLTNEEIVDTSLYISNSSEVSFLTSDNKNPIIKDEFSYSFNFRIAGVIKEFPFLNTPKAYYSAKAIEEELKNNIMENISTYKRKTITYYDYLSECKEDDEISGYAYNIYSSSKEDIKRFNEKKEEYSLNEIGLKIDSTSFEIYSSYKTFMDSLSSALIVFVIIAFVGVNFILGMLTLSSFIARKKESAILTCLGARDGSIINIFMSENYLIILLSYLIAIGLSIPFQILLNKILQSSFGLSSLINIPYLSFFNIPLILPLGLLLLSLLVSSIFLLTPILIYKNKSIVDELRDE